MATFSTYITLTLINAGMPYWVGLFLAVVVSFCIGVLIERILIRPMTNAPSPVLGRRVRRFAADHQQPQRLVLRLHDQAISLAVPRRRRCWAGSSPATSSARPASPWSCCWPVLLFFRYTSLGLAMRAAALNPVSHGWSACALAGCWRSAGGSRRRSARSRADGRAGGVPRPQHDGRHPALCLRRRAARRHRQPAGRRDWRLRVGIIENMGGAYLVGTELKLTLALVIIVCVLTVKPSGLMGRTVQSRV